MCITAPCQRLPRHGCSLRTMGAYDGVLCRAIPESSDSSRCYVLYAFVRRVAQGRTGLFVGDALPHVAAWQNVPGCIVVMPWSREISCVATWGLSLNAGLKF